MFETLSRQTNGLDCRGVPPFGKNKTSRVFMCNRSDGVDYSHLGKKIVDRAYEILCSLAFACLCLFPHHNRLTSRDFEIPV